MPNGESEVLGAAGIPGGKVTGVVAALLANRWVVRIETASGELVGPLVYIQRTGIGDAGNVACTLDEAFQAGDITATEWIEIAMMTLRQSFGNMQRGMH